MSDLDIRRAIWVRPITANAAGGATQGLNITEPIDAFGRLRTSDPTTIFDAGHQYNFNPLVWDSTVVGTGAVTHLPNESAISLSTGGTADLSGVVVQTKTFHRYQPGKSQLVLCTGVFGSPVVNARKRYGYFSGTDGVYYEQTGAGMSVGLRTSTTGTPVDTAVPQAQWNLDRMDGTGPSGITLDWTKAQILLFDMEWLGVGRVRYGVVVGGAIIYTHELAHKNALLGAYMKTANLPVRAEVINTGTAAATATLKQICVSVISEGGQEDDRAFLHSASNGITPIAVTTRRAVLTIRPKLLFNSQENRGQVLPSVVDLFTTANAFYEVVLNATLGGTPSYASVNDASIVEFDVAGTTVTGGVVVASGFLATSGPGTVRATGSNGILGRLPLGLNGAGNVADRLSIVATAFTGTANVNASVTWREFR